MLCSVGGPHFGAMLRRLFSPRGVAVFPTFRVCSRTARVAPGVRKLHSGSITMERHGSLTILPPTSLSVPLSVPQKLLLGAGPGNCPPRILHAGSQPLLGLLDADMVRIMDETKAGLQYAFQTQNEVTLAVSGTGHAAMETALMNIVEPGETVLVLQNGLWGERVTSLCKRLGAHVHTLAKDPGKVFTASDVEKALADCSPAVMFVTHSESSAGLLQSVEGFGSLCQKYNCILVVDTVASLGAVPFFTDRWDVDIVYSGSQKAFSCPPGPSPITFNQRAMNKVTSRKSPVPSFYFDILHLANYWGCDGKPRVYHHTVPMANVYALREGLAILAEEGIEESWRRHREVAQYLWNGIEALGLELLIRNEAHRLPTVTAVCVPDKTEWKKLTQYAMERYAVDIPGGLGPTAGKVWRVGLMGYNSTRRNADTVIRIVREFLQSSPSTLSKL